MSINIGGNSSNSINIGIERSFTRTDKQNLDKNTEARHTHPNKDVLDGITAENVEQWNGAAGSNELADHKDADILDHPDGSVTTEKLADGAVTSDKLADSYAPLDSAGKIPNEYIGEDFITRTETETLIQDALQSLPNASGVSF